MNLHLRRSKRRSDDKIESSPDSPRNNRENNYLASFPQQHQKRQQSSKPVTSKSATTHGRRRKDPTQRTCDTWLEKSTKQGMIIDDDFDDNNCEYEFDGTYENSSSKSNFVTTSHAVNFFWLSGSDQRVSLILSSFLQSPAEKRNNPQHPPRRSSASSTRSSQRLKETKKKAASNEVITIDSSDEGDDTSISASPDVRRVRVQFEFANESIICIHSKTQQCLFLCVQIQQCNFCHIRRVNERLATLHALKQSVSRSEKRSSRQNASCNFNSVRDCRTFSSRLRWMEI